MESASVMALTRSVQLGINVFVISLFLIKPLSALTTQTKQIIHGHGPSLSFDGGVTAASNLQDLLKITLPDNRQYDINHNGQIILPAGQYSLKDIVTSAVADNSAQPIWSVIENSHVYYDHDGDALDPSRTTGTVKATWRNAQNTIITNIDSPLSACSAPYTLTIDVSNTTLFSRYGIPSQRSYASSTKAYTISPLEPSICYIRPDISHFVTPYPGQPNDWVANNGFLVQSQTDYSKNFPTTGADGLYFDVMLKNVNEPLSWQSVTQNNITATVSNITSNSVRITLKGPSYRASGASPFTPTEIELVAKNAQNRAVIKYGFKLTRWFIGLGNVYDRISFDQARRRCQALGQYRVVNFDEVTNSSTVFPSNRANLATRTINNRLVSEWGNLLKYSGSVFSTSSFLYWVYDVGRNTSGRVDLDDGRLFWLNSDNKRAVCIATD